MIGDQEAQDAGLNHVESGGSSSTVESGENLEKSGDGTRQRSSIAKFVKAEVDLTKAQVLLELGGSRAINCSLFWFCMMTLALLFITCYVLGVMLTLCQSEIKAFEKNEWYGLFVERSESVAVPGDTELAFIFLRHMLHYGASKRNMTFLLNDQELNMPHCAWCSSNDLAQMLEILCATVNSYISEETLQDPVGGFNATIAFMNFLGGVLAPEVEFSCVMRLFEPLSAAFHRQLYTIGNETRGITFDCLLNGLNHSLCFPCGNASIMNVTVTKVNETYGIIRDNVSNLTFSTDAADALSERCAFLVIGTFLQSCSYPNSILTPEMCGLNNTKFSTVFGIHDGIASPLNVSDVEEETNEALGRALRKVADGVQGSGIITNNNGRILSNLLDYGVNSSASLSPVFDNTLGNLRASLVGKSQGVFQTLVEQCSSEFNILSLVSPVGNKESISMTNFLSETRLKQVGTCWFAYIFYFREKESCLENIMNQMGKNRTSADERYNAIDIGLAQNYTVYDMVENVLFRPELLPNSHTLYQLGYPTVNMFDARNTNLNLGDEVEGWSHYPLLPVNDTIFERNYEQCFEDILKAPKSLSVFLQFLVEIINCTTPGQTLIAGLIMESICFFLAGLYLLKQLIWFVALPYLRTDFSISVILLNASLVLLCNPSYVVNHLYSWSREDITLTLFFNIPYSKEELKYPGGVFQTAAGLAFFYLHYVLTMVELSKVVSARYHKDVIIHLVVAVCYFCIRGLMAWGLKSDPGWIPFVSLISVGRICALETVSAFPICAGVASSDSVTPFIGTVIIFLSDLVVMFLAIRQRGITSKELRRFPFAQNRNQNLILHYQHYLFALCSMAMVICGIVYVCMISPRIGYDGFFVFSQKGASIHGVSLEFIGVQHWAFGFVLVLFVYAFAWFSAMTSLKTMVGRFLAKQIPPNSRRINFLLTRQELDSLPVDPAEKEHTFVLEDCLINWHLTHSSYHIGKRFQSGEEFLPEGWTQLGYLEITSTDTHVFVSEHQGCIYIAFRGTTSTQNAKTDLTLALKTLAWLESDEDTYSKRANEVIHGFNKELGRGKIRVHSGFLRAFLTEVQTKLTDIIVPYVRNNASKDDPLRISCTGHSLGAGIATICAAFLATAMPNTSVELFTFASPRVGNISFRNFLDRFVLSNWRICKRGDPIPHTPPRLPWSKHHGYTHTGNLCLVEENGDLLLDPNVLEYILLQRCRRGGAADHKAVAYYVSILAFAMQSDAPVSWPVWSNCLPVLSEYVENDRKFGKEFPHIKKLLLTNIVHQDELEQPKEMEMVQI